MLYGITPFHPIVVKQNSLKEQLPTSETLKVYHSFYSNTNIQPVCKLEKAIVHSKELRSKIALDRYKQKGLQWLCRRESQKFPAILRNPTMGCMIELTSKPTLFTVHIDSKEAKKIIWRECYF